MVGMSWNLTHTLKLSTYRLPCLKNPQNPSTNHPNSLMGPNANARPIGSRNCRNETKLDTHTHIIHIQVAIFFKLNKYNYHTWKEVNGLKTQIVIQLGLNAVRLSRNFTKPFIQSIYNYPKSKKWLKKKMKQQYSLLVSYFCCSCWSCWRRVVIVVRFVLELVLLDVFLTRYHHTIVSNHIKGVNTSFQLQTMTYSAWNQLNFDKLIKNTKYLNGPNHKSKAHWVEGWLQWAKIWHKH